MGWGGTKSRTFVLRAPRRRVRGGEGEEGKEERGRGRDSYSRAEGPPAIIFKPLQPTLELVEIKHRITGISASVPATRTPQTDRQDTQTDGQTDRQASTTTSNPSRSWGERSRKERKKEKELKRKVA